MYRHPYFDLWLHSDAELVAQLGSAVQSRTTVHEWPLSCVQRLSLADGRRYIYKAQAAPTVEPDFYAVARSPLLVKARLLDTPTGPAALLLDHLDAPHLADLHLPAAGALRIGEAVLAQIAAIEGDLPASADIRTEALWGEYFREVLAELTALVEGGTFRQVDRALVARLARQSEAPAVLAAFRTPVGYLHRDLTGDNLFVLPEGYRLIDWQRPFYGPVLLDLASILQALGVDPLDHLPSGIGQLRLLLSIAWYAQCARRWFPFGAETYDAAIVRLAAQLFQAA